MLPDLHTDFSRSRSGGLVFPSLSEFSTVSCDPHKGFGIINKPEVDVIFFYLLKIRAYMVALTVKNPPAMGKTWVRSLGWEDPLEEGMETHSSTLALKIPQTEELGASYYPWGHKESGMTE